MVYINLKTLTRSLPSVEGSQIIIREVMTAGDFEKVSAVPKEQFLFEALACMIIDWNLENESGKLPINRTSLALLPLTDLQELFFETDFGKKAKEIEEKKS